MNKVMKKTKGMGKYLITIVVLVGIICSILPRGVMAAGELVELTTLKVSPTFVTNNTNTSGLSIEGAYKVNDPNGANGAVITIKLTPKDAEYVGAINGTTYFENEKYFDTLPVITPDGNMGEATSTIDSEGNILVTIPFIGGAVNAQGNFTVNFPFDHTMFDAKIPSGTPLADVEVTITKDVSVSTLQKAVVSSTPVPNPAATVTGVATDMPADIIKGINLNSGAFILSNLRFEPGSYVILRYTFPKGSIVSGTGGVLDPTTNMVTFTLGSADANGIISNYNAGSITTQTRRIMFPSSEFGKDEPFVIDSSITYTSWGYTEKTVTNQNSGFVRYVEDQPHMDPSKISSNYLGVSPVGVDIKTPSKQGTGAHSYQIGTVEYNDVQSNVPDLKVTWYNDNGTNKARPTQIVFINGPVGSTLRLVIYVKGVGGNDRTYTSLATANSSLQSGEYVEKIEMFPSYNGMDQLLYGATPDIRVYYASWVGGTFPNGTPIKHNDVSNISATVSWPNEVAPEMFSDIDTDPNTTTVQLRNLSVLYYETLIQPIITVIRNSDINNNPGDVVSTSIQIQNRAQAINNWNAPELYILPPAMTTIDPDQDFPVRAYGTNESLGNATIEGPMTVEGIEGEVYKLVLPPEISLTISHPNGSNTETNTCLVDVQYTIKEGTPTGSYYLAGSNATSYPNMYGRVMAASVNDDYIYTTSTLAWDDSTADLDGNSNTPSLPMANTGAQFNVRAVNTLAPNADMYNAEESEWQLLTDPNAQSTVPLEGTGQVKLTLTNEGNSYIGDIRLLDILPSLKDEQVLSPYGARNTQWDALLQGTPEVKITDGEGVDKTADFNYSLRYSTLADPNYNAGGITRTGGTGTFSNNATAETAKSFDFSLTNRLPAGYTIEILLTVKAPATATLAQIGQVAYNSFAVNGNFYSSVSGGSIIQNGVPFEPNNQKFILTEIPTASITNLKGLVFKDFNANSLYDAGVEVTPGIVEGDIPYSGLTVELYKWDTDTSAPTGEAIKTTTTQADGSYVFEDLYGGTYVTRVLKPEAAAYKYALRGSEDNAFASHADENGYGYPVTVTPGGLTELTENAGIQANGSVIVRFKAGTTQVGSDIATKIPFTSNLVNGSVKAGSTTYPIPIGYHLIASEVETKDYTIVWDVTTTQEIEYQIAKDTYNVSYSYTNSPMGVPTLPTAQAVAWGESANVATAPTLPGYVFSGWETSDVSVSDGSFIMPQKGVAFTGSWTLLNYDITYDYANGVAPTTLNPIGYNVEDAFPIVIGNEPTRVGYTFTGWMVAYDNEDISDSSTPIKGYSIPKGTIGDIKLTATWKLNAYVLDFDLNDAGTPISIASGKPEDQKIEYGSKAVKPNDPIRAGYTFDGWYEDEACMNSFDFNVDTMPASNKTLYAKWILNMYTVTYNPGVQGTFATEVHKDIPYGDQTPLFGGEVGSDGKPVGKEGYTFIGWDVEVMDTVTKNMTYTALWEAIPIDSATYSVEHYLQQADDSYLMVDSEVLQGSVGDTVVAINKQYEGYTFDETVVGSILRGTLREDNRLVLKVYYVRDKVAPPKQDIIMKPSISTAKQGSAGVDTGDVTNIEMWVLTMIGMLGVILVLKRKGSKE